LMGQLQVGRSSLREALRTLSLVGLLEARPGSGTYVTSSFSSFLAEQLEWSALLGGRDLLELVEVRWPLEIQAAQLAAQRADEKDLCRLRDTVSRLAETDDQDLARQVELDLEFHMGLAEATGNRVLIRLVQSLHGLLKEYIAETVRATPRPVETTLKEHRAALQAIEARDTQQVAEAMRRHMATSREELLSVLSRRRSGQGKP
jgi:GntR family transcriptional repressor for pyruvate dehydrogenase complex